MHILAQLALFALGWTVGLATLLGAIGRLGPGGRRAADWLTRAPGLDLAVAALTWLPWAPAVAFGGWLGLPAAIAGQMVGLGLWILGHEQMHRRHVEGPRIVRFLNGLVGRWRNHAALWVTALSFPIFWFIRAAEVLVYPLLPLLVGLPRYNQAEWVNVSRQKFSGLVGHDLVWCLYCDWMTGVYALGGEMLRNVESFWCPIRFYDGKKCANCKVDFPDIDPDPRTGRPGWVRAEGDMGEVVALMERMYGEAASTGGDLRPAATTSPDGAPAHAAPVEVAASGRRGWFGHPARLTVNGQSPAAHGRT